MRGPQALISLVTVVLVLGAGCAANKAIQIRSAPSGATVFVDGKQVGLTPLVLTTNDLMPRRAFDAKPSTQAMLVIEKPGYSSYQLLLHEFSLPDEVNAELQPQAQPAASTIGPASDVVKEIERLQQLREKGAITEEEFQKLKQAALARATNPPPP
jgi:hypothetical protein